MAKYCRFDNLEIPEEIGSLELREFTRSGKICSYFHDISCLEAEFDLSGGKTRLLSPRLFRQAKGEPSHVETNEEFAIRTGREDVEGHESRRGEEA